MIRIAILGRPNVGKSSLFNRLCRRSIAIVNSTEGTTRDRLHKIIQKDGFDYEIIDTGGVDDASVDKFQKAIKSHALQIASNSDILLFVVDIKCGITHPDLLLAESIRRLNKPVILIANKADTPKDSKEIIEFYGLGISNMIAVSAAHGRHIENIFETVRRILADKPIENENTNSEIEEINSDNTDSTTTITTTTIKVAVIGRPNVGKSTFINSLLKDNRCLTDNVPGTTRDNIDIMYRYQDQNYLFIDTAGISKKKSLKTSVDWISTSRSEKAIVRSDICLFIIDAESGLTAADKRLLSLIAAKSKPFIVIINKWDLLQEVRMEHYIQDVRNFDVLLEHAPVLCISALESRNLSKVFPIMNGIETVLDQKITTHSINKLLEQAIQRHHPPIIGGKRLRIYYTTKIGSRPPEFLFFINSKSLFDKNYEQYIKNYIRDAFNYHAIPFKIKIKEKPKR
ncbi:MAG: ribosome biogenesis GTPase Der [Victivallaceae bacterium]